MTLYFDEEGDILEITVGCPRKSLAKELKDDIFVRYDPETGEIVGIMILNFLKQFMGKKRPEEIEFPLNITITTN